MQLFLNKLFLIRKAQSNTLSGETCNLILEDTKIIESFANDYGEEIYKKFPEYGILQYIKKIFGETELKDFTEYTFDSTGSYWKVNDSGDLIDDGTKWSTNPGKIDHSKIEDAYKAGKLTEDQYNMIQLAAGLAEKSNEKTKKISLFSQILTSYQEANEIKTQIHVDMFNRAWEWVKSEWNKLSSKLKDKPEKGWNVMLMRSMDSKGKIIGLAPHMAVIFVNDDYSISVAHYTGGEQKSSDNWTQNGLENDGSDNRGGFKYNSFSYYPLKEKEK